MLNLFVCQICGEPHLADEVPTDCQFCGAPKNYLKPAEEFSPVWGIELTDQEKQDVEATLALEVNATAFYLDAAKANQKYTKYERLFKAFARVEKEHADVAAKILGVDVPDFVGEKTRGSPEADLERTKELETGAVAHYAEFMARATSEKMKNFFNAFKHAEEGHRDYATAELA
ncbi:ferritin family protein [archaeon]